MFSFRLIVLKVVPSLVIPIDVYKRFERFMRLVPHKYSGVISDDAYNFLISCHERQ